MELVIGKMGFPPHVFWDMSMEELSHCIEGFIEFHSSGKETPMTRDELNSLMERYPD